MPNILKYRCRVYISLSGPDSPISAHYRFPSSRPFEMNGKCTIMPLVQCKPLHAHCSEMALNSCFFNRNRILLNDLSIYTSILTKFLPYFASLTFFLILLICRQEHIAFLPIVSFFFCRLQASTSCIIFSFFLFLTLLLPILLTAEKQCDSFSPAQSCIDLISIQRYDQCVPCMPN